MNPITNHAADQLLLIRLAKGDRQAFADLYLRYYDGLYNYLLKFTKNEGLTQDLVQDIFLKYGNTGKNWISKLPLPLIYTGLPATAPLIN